jgi:hypothetical protein
MQKYWRLDNGFRIPRSAFRNQIMDNFTLLLFALAAVAGAVFFGYPVGLRRGHRDGFKLGERYGRAETQAEEHRIQTELTKAATECLKSAAARNADVLSADTLEDTK